MVSTVHPGNIFLLIFKDAWPFVVLTLKLKHKIEMRSFGKTSIEIPNGALRNISIVANTTM